MPKVSIIVPVYKVEPYLRRCVDSILNQTYQDNEIILVDDGSPDNCGKICDEYARRFDCISVVHKENGGLSDARNAGVAVAKGEWGLFIDSDDLIHPQMVEFLIKAAMETDSNIVLCGRLQAENVPDDFYKERILSYKSFDIDENKLIELYNSKEIILSNMYWVVVPKLTRLKILKKYPFTKGRIYEDNAVAFKMLIEAKKISIVNQKMYFYRINQAGIMHSKLSKKKLDYLWALEEQIKFYEKIQYDRMCKKITSELIGSTFFYYSQCKKEGDDELCNLVKCYLIRYLKQYKKYIEDDDKSIERKSDRIIKPKVYRIKKILKIY